MIIAKLDRAFRNLADCAAMLRRFESMGIKLHICNLMGGALDLSSPMGRFLIHILAAFAELERDFISERTRDGLARKYQEGYRYTNFPGYGFKWEKRHIGGKVRHVKVADPEERAVMKSIVQWRLADPPMSWYEISQHLMYTLKLKGRNGEVWDQNRCKRAAKAELALQNQERFGSSGTLAR